MEIVWTDPSVLSALISAVGGILAAAITAITATLVGKRFIDQRYLKERLVLAQEDIAFLLCVEEEHCKQHTSNTGSSLKIKMRNKVRDRGFDWSGKFTPSRSNARLARLGLEADKPLIEMKG